MSGDTSSPDTATELSPAEQRVVDRGRAWIRDNEAELIDLLETLVGTPSVTGDEGGREEPETVVGRLSSHLSSNLDEATVAHQRVQSTPQQRDNCYAILDGASDELLVCTSHTDTVAPGDPTDWPGDDPFGLRSGVISHADPGVVELSVGGDTERRSIRDAYDDIWGQRDHDERTALVGRGAYDNKAAIVCLVGAMRALEQACVDGYSLDGTVVHGHLVGEEVSQVGAKAMVGWGDRPSWLGRRYPEPEGAVVVMDGSYGYVPAVGHRGLAWLTLTADGESAHASTPHLGQNAVLGAARALAATEGEAFRSAVERPFADDELLGDLTVAAGTTMVGGSVTRDSDGRIERAGVNAVPDWCETTFDIRFPRWSDYPDGVERIREHIESAVESHAGEHAPELDVTAEVDPDEFFPPVALADSRAAAREHPLVDRALDATAAAVGYDPGVTVAPGVTDAAAIYPELRLPTLVEYGPAGALSHEPLEFVERESVIAGAEAMVELTVRQLGVA